jgi:uncharacterized membrane protein YbhN (UPF0104 family)
LVLLPAALAAWAGWDRVLADLGRLRPGTLGILFALPLVNYLLRAVRWQLFQRAIGIRLPWWRTLVYFVAGLALTATPGKAGEALRLYLIERGHGYRYDRLAALFLGDRLGDMCAVLLLCLLAAGAFSGYAVYAAVVGAGVAGCLVLLMRRRPLLAALGWLHRRTGRRWPKPIARCRRMVRLAAQLLRPPVSGPAILLSLVSWFAEVLALVVLVRALGVPITLQQATFVFTFSIIAGTVAMLPGGFGGTEAAMVGLLRVMGAPFDVAVAATLLIRLATLGSASALGFLALPLAFRLVGERRPRAALRLARMTAPP